MCHNRSSPSSSSELAPSPFVRFRQRCWSPANEEYLRWLGNHAKDEAHDGMRLSQIQHGLAFTFQPSSRYSTCIWLFGARHLDRDVPVAWLFLHHSPGAEEVHLRFGGLVFICKNIAKSYILNERWDHSNQPQNLHSTILLLYLALFVAQWRITSHLSTLAKVIILTSKDIRHLARSIVRLGYTAFYLLPLLALVSNSSMYHVWPL
jgi:hypothetical protein